MKRRCILILCLALVLCACAPKQPAPPVTTVPAATEPTQTIPVTTEPVLRIPVETPCGTLYLPDDWDEPIEVETTLGDPMILTFIARETILYQLSFGQSSDGAIGQVSTGDGIAYLGLMLPSLETEDEMLYSMQESVNELLIQLAPEPVTTPAGEPDISIQTGYGEMRFPGKWAEHLMTEQPEEDTLDFYCVLPERPPVLLFTAVFGTDKGGIAAVITDNDGSRTPLIFLQHALSFDDSWSSQEMDLVYAMQEDLNFLLATLEE